MENRMQKIYSPQDKKIVLKAYEGHFATPHSHITHYFDMTTLRTRASEAEAAARLLAEKSGKDVPVDTIVCMEGMTVIGAYLAQELTRAGVPCMNAHETIYVTEITGEGSGQMLLPGSRIPLVKNKNVMILTSAVSTGQTLKARMDSVKYYGGTLRGICSVFSAVRRVAGMEIHTIFTASQVPDYQSAVGSECVHCRAGKRLDALVNSVRYSEN